MQVSSPKLVWVEVTYCRNLSTGQKRGVAAERWLSKYLLDLCCPMATHPEAKVV